MDLSSLQNRSSRANAIPANGNVIVGWDENPRQDSQYHYWYGAMWWPGMERLMNPYGWIGQAEAANDVGSIIVGRGPAEREQEYRSHAFAVSDDGNVVVGISVWQPPTDAFIWTPETKMVKVSDYLISNGVTGHTGWTLTNAVAVSRDGKVIAGTG